MYSNYCIMGGQYVNAIMTVPCVLQVNAVLLTTVECVNMLYASNADEFFFLIFFVDMACMRLN